MRRALALLILALGILPLAAQPASAAIAAHVENRASAFAAATDIRFWNTAPLSEERVEENHGLSYDFASGYAVAARAGTTTLYRAVSAAEHADIVANGALRAGPNSLSTGKWFWESAEHAAEFGTKMDGAGNFRIIEATFPRSAADQFMRLDRLDGIGPARFGTFEQLGDPLLQVLP